MFNTVELMDVVMKWAYTTGFIFSALFIMTTYLDYKQKEKIKSGKCVK